MRCQRDAGPWSRSRAAGAGGRRAVAISRAKPIDAEAVGPVGGDLEVDDGVAVAERLDRRDLEAAQGQLLGDLLSRSRHVDEVTNPGKEKAHRSRFSVLGSQSCQSV